MPKPTPPNDPPTPVTKSRDGEAGHDGPSPGSGRAAIPGARFAPLLAAGALGLLLALGVASLLGDTVRSALLLELDTSPLGAHAAFTDAPDEAARFFALRDSVRVRVPWEMTLATFVGLYHLETNASAKAALGEQLGAYADDDVLAEGAEVAFTLTATRPGG